MGYQGVAVADYNSGQENQLSFKTGAIINLIENKEQWWNGELNGRVNCHFIFQLF